MKLWKILLATTIALILMCAVAMADTCKTCDMATSLSEIEPATCTETGLWGQRYCIHSNCDNYNTYVNKTVVAALGHNPQHTGTEDSTCTTEGYHSYMCAREGCDYTWTVTIEKKDHDTARSSQLSTPATCTEPGLDVLVCKDCYEVVYKPTAATGHTWTSIAGKPATCTEDGYTMHQECTACGATNGGAVIPALGHDFSVLNDTANENATCTEDGYWLYKCSRCTETKKEITETAIGHVITRVVEEVEATCTEDGYISYACANCRKVDAVKEITEKATGHVMTRKVGESEATCEEGAYVAYACAKCYEAAAEKVYSSEALGHNYSELYENHDSSCTAEGWRIYNCVNAGCTKQYTVTVDKIAHNYAETEWETKVEATCVLPGTEKNHCTMCNGAWIERETAALGHDLSKDTYVKKAATCTESGIIVKVCERKDCGYEVTEVINALDHDYDEDIVANATCELVGMKHITCKREGCDYLEANVIIPKLGHDGEVTEYVAPTCTTEGKKTIECETCENTVTETLPKLAHTYEWVTVSNATPTSDGKKEYKCDCGDVADVKVVKYTKWYYNNTMTSFGPTTKELVGGSDWYRVTPVDVSVDGVYVYDLVASNKYVVGTVTITVNAGALTVTYDAKYGVEVTDEDLLIYASKADLAAGTAVTANVGAAINVAETFGADTKVLVSLILTGNYDAAGKSYIDTDAVSAMLVNVD